MLEDLLEKARQDGVPVDLTKPEQRLVIARWILDQATAQVDGGCFPFVNGLMELSTSFPDDEKLRDYWLSTHNVGKSSKNAGVVKHFISELIKFREVFPSHKRAFTSEALRDLIVRHTVLGGSEAEFERELNTIHDERLSLGW